MQGGHRGPYPIVGVHVGGRGAMALRGGWGRRVRGVVRMVVVGVGGGGAVVGGGGREGGSRGSQGVGEGRTNGGHHISRIDHICSRHEIVSTYYYY